jgi:hypothetical protein
MTFTQAIMTSDDEYEYDIQLEELKELLNGNTEYIDIDNEPDCDDYKRYNGLLNAPIPVVLASTGSKFNTIQQIDLHYKELSEQNMVDYNREKIVKTDNEMKVAWAEAEILRALKQVELEKNLAIFKNNQDSDKYKNKKPNGFTNNSHRRNTGKRKLTHNFAPPEVVTQRRKEHKLQTKVLKSAAEDMRSAQFARDLQDKAEQMKIIVDKTTTKISNFLNSLVDVIPTKMSREQQQEIENTMTVIRLTHESKQEVTQTKPLKREPRTHQVPKSTKILMGVSTCELRTNNPGKPDKPRNIKCKKVCNSVKLGKLCNRGDVCIFAHTGNELIVEVCGHDKRGYCNRGLECFYKHQKETTNQYLGRMGFNMQVKSISEHKTRNMTPTNPWRK